MKTKENESAALHMLGKSVGTLAYYYRRAEDASCMEQILSNILQGELRKKDGKRTPPWYEQNGLIGRIWVGKYNNPDSHHLDIVFCPSPLFEPEVRYVQSPIGTINLVGKTYGLKSPDSPKLVELLGTIDETMCSWGLKKVDFKRSLQF